jgi:hypothetical protein
MNPVEWLIYAATVDLLCRKRLGYLPSRVLYAALVVTA